MSAAEWAGWWGAATGTVSVSLLGARFIWDRREDARDVQREVRGELRQILDGVNEEFQTAKQAMNRGRDVGPVGPHTAAARAKLARLKGRLVKPDPTWINILDMTISMASSRWTSLAGSESAPSSSSSSAQRLSMDQHALRDAIETAQPHVDDVLRQLDAIDKGRK